MISKIDDRANIPMLFMPKVEQTVSHKNLLKKEYAIYIHIPFCERRCHFCAIPVMQFINEEVLDDYLNELLHEMEVKGNILKGNILRGIHIGGGTPSVFSALQIRKLFEAIINQFGEKIPEIVFEANPASLNKDKIDVLANYHNVTLNFGIQTFDSQRLREINRFDDIVWIKDCLQYAIRKKHMHVGIDLIVGLPDSKIVDFDNDLKIIKELEIKNVFLHPYRMENKSFFYECNSGRKYFSQSEIIRYMEHAEDNMQNSGFYSKSIYYWSKERKQLYLYTAHQMNGGEWFGIGAGAYSYFNQSVQYNDLTKQKLYGDDGDKIFRQNITSQMIWDMTFMVKNNVFETKRIIQKYGKIAEPYLKNLIKRLDEYGYSQKKNNKICLSIKGKVLLDDVDKIIQEIVLNERESGL